MTPTPKKRRQQSPEVKEDEVPNEPSASSAAPKKKARANKVPKTEQLEKPANTKVEEVGNKRKRKGAEQAPPSEEVAPPPRIKDPALNYTKTFARRRRPNSDAGALKWDALRTVFNEYIKPQLASYSAHEDGWEGGRSPGRIIEVRKYIVGKVRYST